MSGAVIITIVLFVVIPIGVIVTGAVVASIRCATWSIWSSDAVRTLAARLPVSVVSGPTLPTTDGEAWSTTTTPAGCAVPGYAMVPSWGSGPDRKSVV